MRPLPQGVTGFDAPEAGVSVERFARACYAAARHAQGRVHHVQMAYEDVTPNFHEAAVTLRDGLESVRVLCNAHHPIIAFVLPAAYEGDVRLQFIDCSQLAEPLSGEFDILSTSEAGATISPEAMSQLTEVELHYIQHWNPQRIGDVIFNYWD